jgi:putative endonuclease
MILCGASTNIGLKPCRALPAGDIGKLVWFEIYDDAITAIAREKELKKWRRAWKIRLIEEQNPNWDDLYLGIAS